MFAADGTHSYHASTRSPASIRLRVLTIDIAVVLSTRCSARRPSITYATGGFAYAHLLCVAISRSRSQEFDMCMHICMHIYCVSQSPVAGD